MQFPVAGQPPSRGPSPTLPPLALGWEMIAPENGSQVYYYNRHTGATQVERPVAPVAGQPPSRGPSPTLPPLALGWEMIAPENGSQVYYYNRHTGATQVERPAAVAVPVATSQTVSNTHFQHLESPVTSAFNLAGAPSVRPPIVPASRAPARFQPPDDMVQLAPFTLPNFWSFHRPQDGSPFYFNCYNGIRQIDPPTRSPRSRAQESMAPSQAMSREPSSDASRPPVTVIVQSDRRNSAQEPAKRELPQSMEWQLQMEYAKRR